MTVPRPDELDREITALLRSLSELRQEYRWVHAASLQPSVVETAGSLGIGQADATGGIVASKGKAHMRSECRAAVKAVREAANDVASHHRRLQRLMGQRGIPTIPRGGGPRTVTLAELAESQENARVRASRGEGFGEA